MIRFVLQILINRIDSSPGGGGGVAGLERGPTVHFLSPVTDPQLATEECAHGTGEPARPPILVTHVESLPIKATVRGEHLLCYLAAGLDIRVQTF